MNRQIICILALGLVLDSAPAYAQQSTQDTRPGIAPDIREDETELKLQKGDFVVVPIPISNPTLNTGLVAGAAYFYPQTEEQKKAQPASVTAGAAMYTNNESRAFGLVQQNYWNQDKWRFTGAIGGADLRLSLIAADETSSGRSLDWRIKGNFLSALVSRRLAGDWYAGLSLRVIDANQAIEGTNTSSDFDTGDDVRSAGIGLSVEYDARDMPLNTYRGSYLKAEGLFNDEALSSNQTYQSYSLAYRSYHELSDSLVLAWEAQGCARGGTAPLWDACMVKLRGFAATDYLGKVSGSGQLEARWRMNERWGLVGFAGAGYVGSSFSGNRDNEAIPSYGAGIRFMVLPAKRINIRLDFARSVNSDAIHFSVGEAF